MKIKVLIAGIYNNLYGKAALYAYGEVLDTTPAYGKSLLEDSYAATFASFEGKPEPEVQEPELEEKMPVGPIEMDFDEKPDDPVESVSDLMASVVVEETAEAVVPISFLVKKKVISSAVAETIGLNIGEYTYQIEAASDEELLALAGVGEKTVEKIRVYFKNPEEA
jgi:hypothetical protein